jgi:hypothetical protein
MIHVTIPVVSVAEFRTLMCADPNALETHPFVVEGVVDRWPLVDRWRDLGYLTETFGDQRITAGAPQFVTHRDAGLCQVHGTFAEYLRYVNSPEEVETIFRGRWTYGSAEELKDLNRPLYCGDLRVIQGHGHRLLHDLRRLTPDGMESWDDYLPFYYESRNHVWLYVGRAGSLTPLHTDNNAVISYLAQLSGSKRAVLLSPAERDLYFKPHIGYLDILGPDIAEFPRWREIHAWSAELLAGQVLIWGPNWAHHVVTIEDSVTISLDIVNSSNLRAYARSVDWMQTFADFAVRNRARVEGEARNAFVDLLCKRQSSTLGATIMMRVLSEDLLSNKIPAQERYVKSQFLRHIHGWLEERISRSSVRG